MYTASTELKEILEENHALVSALAKVSSLAVEPIDAPRPKGAATQVVDGMELLVPLKGIIDLDAERARLNKEREKTSKLMEGALKKLGNEKFLGKAPEDVIAKERAKLDDGKANLAKIEQALKRLDEVDKA